MHVCADRCASPPQFPKTSRLADPVLPFLPARRVSLSGPWLASPCVELLQGAWSCHVEPFSGLRSRVPPAFDWPPTRHKLPPGHCLERLSGSVVPEPLLCQFTAATSWANLHVCRGAAGTIRRQPKKKDAAVQPPVCVCRGPGDSTTAFLPSISCPCSLLKCIFPAPRAALQKTGSLPVPMVAPSRHLDA